MKALKFLSAVGLLTISSSSVVSCTTKTLNYSTNTYVDWFNENFPNNQENDIRCTIKETTNDDSPASFNDIEEYIDEVKNPSDENNKYIDTDTSSDHYNNLKEENYGYIIQNLTDNNLEISHDNSTYSKLEKINTVDNISFKQTFIEYSKNSSQEDFQKEIDDYSKKTVDSLQDSLSEYGSEMTKLLLMTCNSQIIVKIYIDPEKDYENEEKNEITFNDCSISVVNYVSNKKTISSSSLLRNLSIHFLKE